MKGRGRHFAPGNKYLFAYLAFISAFAPLSTDMYLPALPAMGSALDASNELISCTISMFLLVFGVSMLFWGPVSDKYGRKPVLIGGSMIFVLSSSAIALADSIWTIIFWRILQAMGSGAASAMSLALVKDLFRGKTMEKIVGLLQAATILAPMLAPVIGGGLLYITTWRGIFWCLAFLGAISMAGGFCLRETARKQDALPLHAVFGRIFIVLQNAAFRKLLVLFSLMAMPFMAYLGVCAFIYQDYFQVSAQVFSIFFAFNATVSLAGPLLHITFLHTVNRNLLIGAELFLSVLSGAAVLLFGAGSPWLFAALFACVTLCGSALRPPSTVMMMESVKGDNGIVTALINCGGLLCGSLSMFLAALAFWPNPITAVGAISMTVAGICLALWLKYKKTQTA